MCLSFIPYGDYENFQTTAAYDLHCKIRYTLKMERNCLYLILCSWISIYGFSEQDLRVCYGLYVFHSLGSLCKHGHDGLTYNGNNLIITLGALHTTQPGLDTETCGSYIYEHPTQLHFMVVDQYPTVRLLCSSLH